VFGHSERIRHEYSVGPFYHRLQSLLSIEPAGGRLGWIYCLCGRMNNKVVATAIVLRFALHVGNFPQIVDGARYR